MSHELAKSARQQSYSPYSGFAVGAAVKFSGDLETYTGTNVENASYGATVCAERTAIWKRVTEKGKGLITDLWLVTDGQHPPCGMCLQVIGEFSNEQTLVHLGDLQSVYKTVNFSDLLPQSFSLSK